MLFDVFAFETFESFGAFVAGAVCELPLDVAPPAFAVVSLPGFPSGTSVFLPLYSLALSLLDSALL